VSFIARLLFEDLSLLLMAEFAVLMIVLAVHRRRMTPRTRQVVWMTLGLCAALILLNKLVVTDAEKIVDAVRTMALAVDEGNVPVVADGLDSEFRYHQWDKAGFVGELNRKLQEWRIDEVDVGRFEIEISGSTAKVCFRASCDWKGASESQTGVTSDWTQEWVRRPDGWKLRRIVGAKLLNGLLNLNDVWNY
jgi:hypothetical protein